MFDYKRQKRVSVFGSYLILTDFLLPPSLPQSVIFQPILFVNWGSVCRLVVRGRSFSFLTHLAKTHKTERAKKEKIEKRKMSENRRVNYKFGAKGDKDARRKERQDNSIQLRKSAREEQMLKRRNVCMGESF